MEERLCEVGSSELVWANGLDVIVGHCGQPNERHWSSSGDAGRQKWRPTPSEQRQHREPPPGQLYGKHNKRAICPLASLNQLAPSSNRSSAQPPPRRARTAAPSLLLLLLPRLLVVLPLMLSLAHNKIGALPPPNSGPVIYVKVGALFEESDHEQANIFIRTIKMINERRDETIRQLLNISTSNTVGSHNQQQRRRQSEQLFAPLHFQDDAGAEEDPLKAVESSGASDNHDDRDDDDDNDGGGGSSGRSSKQEPADELKQGSFVGTGRIGDNDSLAVTSLAATTPTQGQFAGLATATAVAAHDNNSLNFKLTSSGGGAHRDAVVKLEPMIEFLADRQNSFEADSKVCQLIESGVHALVGPRDGASIQHVQSICDNMEIPYFELRSFLGSLAAPSVSISASSAAASSSSSLSPTSGLTSPSNRHWPGLQVGGDHDDADMDSVALSESGSDLNGDADGLKQRRNHKRGPKASSGSSPPPAHQSAAATGSLLSNNRLEDLTLNLYPPAHLLTSAYIDLIYAWNWTSFAIVYEEGSSMIKLQDLFRESSGSWTSRWQIKLFQFNPDIQQQHQQEGSNAGNGNNNNNNEQNNNGDQITDQQRHAADHDSSGSVANGAPSSGAQTTASELAGGDDAEVSINDPMHRQQPSAVVASSDNHSTSNHDDNGHQTSPRWQHRPKRKMTTFRDIFWRVKLSGEQNILLDVKTEHLYEALKHAQQVGCMTERFSYLITSLDLHNIDLEDFKYSRTRITAFNLIQVSRNQPPPMAQPGNQDAAAALSSSVANGSATTSTSNLTLVRRSLADEQLLAVGPTPASVAFDEKYLEKLGVHVIQSDPETELAALSRARAQRKQQQQSNGNAEYYSSRRRPGNGDGIRPHRLSPSIVLNKSGQFMDPPPDAYKDWSKREQLQSLPASMSLLPSLDRDNEQKLFEFFVDQQERNLSRVRLSTASAILHDSLVLFTLGLNELDPGGQFMGDQPPPTGANGGAKRHATEEPATPSMGCSADSRPWLHGSSLVNYMRRISFSGLTGTISFDQRGLRSDFKLDMMGMAPDIGLVKVGEWHSRLAADSGRLLKSGSGPDITRGGPREELRSYDELSSHYERELKRYQKLLAAGAKVFVPYTKPMSRQGALLVNEVIFERLYREQADQVDTLIVTTKLSQPYFMLKETPNKLEGNDQYEGFAVDLIHELSKLVNFKYRWREVADKKYGSKETLPNGTVVWNGMIGEIVRGQADLAIVDLTITAQREEAVDFTLPFMNTGISILFKKPTTKVTTLFSFLSPFSSDVWAYVLAAYCGISANLFFVGHLSPYEWSDPHPCRHTSEDVETMLKNQFSLLNSFWFTIGSLMQQGSDLTPRSMSTRALAGIWYFFTLIMISSYTANLAAFLTVEKVVYPIENVRDLSNQQEIKYGCVESGSTCTFFHDSQIDTYKRINETMRKYRTYVRSNDEGQKRVEEGKFAFFMESASIEYIVERNCNLTQIGGLLDSKGYGLATSKRARLKRPYRTLLSEGILHLQETGMLHILKNRWWKERRGGGTCTDDGKGSGVTELSLANVGGVFVVLLGGLGISFLVAIAEFIWRSRRSGATRDRMCEEMMSDLKFALACKRSRKPVTPRPSTRTSGGNRLALAHQPEFPVLPSDTVLCATICDRVVGGNTTATDELPLPLATDQEYDPIVLHAMLTMLMQQEQQHLKQQTEQYVTPSVEGQVGGISSGVVGTGASQTETADAHYRSNRLLLADSADSNTVAGPDSGDVSSGGDERLTDERRRQWHQQQQEEWYSGTSGPSRLTETAGRRRLLFAQQTVDSSADESIAAWIRRGRNGG